MAKKAEEVKTILDPVVAAIVGGKFDGVAGFGSFVEKRPFISTGSLGLDLKFGGGLARDRIIEYYGPSGSCKTSLALIALSDYVNRFGYDRYPFIVDLERTITADFVRGFNIDPDRVLVLRPKTAEDTLNVVSNCMNSGKFGFGILDSIDGLESKEDRDKNYGEASMMKLPKLMSEAMRDLSKASVDNDCGLILINQVRTGLSNYQAVETTSGGKAIQYYCSYRLRVSKKGPSENRADALEIKAVPKKNKLFPLIEAETSFDFIPGVGVDTIGDYLDAAKQMGVITQGGPYYSVWNGGEEPLVKVLGRGKFEEWLAEGDNDSLFNGIVKKKFEEISHTMVSDKKEEEQDSLTE